jgi:hypothetical protein
MDRVTGEFMSEINRIVEQLDRAMEGEAWHGPSLEELLKDVTEREAAAHPVASAHSIWELVEHLAAWNFILAKRAAGISVAVTPEQDWPLVTDTSEEHWKLTMNRLREARARLRASVLQLKDEQLENIAPGKNHSIYVMLHGGIQHDLYHAGQIAVLKKALR